MAFTESEKNVIRATWEEKQQKLREREALLKKEAWNRALQIARFLKNKYRIHQVYLYGSLAEDQHFDTHSDIDLFIAGWTENQNYWKMISEVEDLSRPYPVSIVTEKDALPSLLDRVMSEGRILE
jgi:predicted nucleotidyltransferase